MRAKHGNPKGTNDFAAAATDDAGKPLSNPGRDTWVTATALSTALNVSFMAYNLALFGVVVGIALLLSGIGFIILAVLALGRRAAPKTGRRMHGGRADRSARTELSSPRETSRLMKGRPSRPFFVFGRRLREPSTLAPREARRNSATLRRFASPSAA